MKHTKHNHKPNQFQRSLGVTCCQKKGDNCNHPMCHHCRRSVQDALAKKTSEFFKHVPTENLYAIAINLIDIPVGTNPSEFPSIQRRAIKNFNDRLTRNTADLSIMAGKEISYSIVRHVWNLHIHGFVASALPLCLLETVIKKVFPPRFHGEHRVFIEKMDPDKTRDENIRDYMGYSVKTSYSGLQGPLVKQFIMLMNTMIHGGSFGLTFTFNRDNQFLKPRTKIGNWEQYFMKSMLDRNAKCKLPPKAYTAALRSHRGGRRNSNPAGRILLMCPSQLLSHWSRLKITVPDTSTAETPRIALECRQRCQAQQLHH